MKLILILLFFLSLCCQNVERKWQNPLLASKNDRRLIWQNIPLDFCPQEISFSIERLTDKVLLEGISQNCVFLSFVEIREKIPYLTHILILSEKNYEWQGMSPAKFFDTGWGKKWEFVENHLKIEIFLSWSTLELYFKDLFH